MDEMNICSHALFQHLVDDLVEGTGSSDLFNPPPNAPPRIAAATLMATGFLSKLQDDLKPSADANALEKFKACNKKCSEWELRKESMLDEYLIGEFKRAVTDFLEPQGEPIVSTLYDLLDRGRTGPGTSLGAKGQSFYAKFFSSNLTTTRPLLYEMYSRWVEQDFNWSEAERIRQMTEGSCTIVHGSRLSFVPKKEDCSRVICVEPSLNMYYQLGLEDILKSRLLRSFKIDLSKQPDVNRELARIGSSTGKFATVDLSSASDTISLSMLESLFPTWFVDILKTIRSPSVELPDGTCEELHMVSSMGNGSTFPLETIIFACAVRAVYRLDSLKEQSNFFDPSKGFDTWWNFSVFGDDIIIDCRSFLKLKRLLEILGFTLNSDKTFVEGPFRESCGHDFQSGSYVRPVFVKTLKEQGSLYALINNLNRWSYLTGISLGRTVKYLTRGVKRYYVPLHENADSGIRVPHSMVKEKRFDRHTGSPLYKRWIVRPKRHLIGELEIQAPKGFKKLTYNPHGLMLAYLRGGITGHALPVRLDRVAYRTKYCVTPHWDYAVSTFPIREGEEVDWRRLNSALYFNLFG